MSLTLNEIPLFQGFTRAELTQIRKCIKEKTFCKGEVLHSESDQCEKIFFVAKGRVKIFRTASSGREQILEILKEGDTCACNPGETEWNCQSSAEALEDGVAWYLSRVDYRRLVDKSEKLARTLNRLFANRLQCLSMLVEEVSLKDAKKRLVKFLLDMLQEKKSGQLNNQTLFIPFTREEIAQRLGTARETVARYLSDLKSDKLIDLKPYQIIILDREGLQALLS